MATGRRGCAGPGRAEQGRRRAPARSPHDRSLLGRAAQAAPGDADVAVATARAAFNSGPWLHMDPEERQEVIRRVNGLREERAAEAAARVSAATGTPRRFADAEQASLTRRVDACEGRRGAGLGGDRPFPRPLPGVRHHRAARGRRRRRRAHPPGGRRGGRGGRGIPEGGRPGRSGHLDRADGRR
nr:aldehyde dehydrogenase family protein [Streptomyces sp. SID8377]